MQVHLRAKENTRGDMVKGTMDCGKMEKDMDKGQTIMLMDQYILGIGELVYKRGMEFILLMRKNLKECGNKANKMVMVNKYFQVILFMKGNLRIIYMKDMVNKHYRVGKCMKDIGRSVKEMAMEEIILQMEIYMMVTGKMMYVKVMGYLLS